ncbi:MAG: DUF4339 domain-containing protein [Planctomycetaceae bacterium]|nr:DUF4339 domain-containing protein [Planctomycetaceae bacterium]
MTNQWFAKIGDHERGPISFQDVAFLIHDGQLAEDGLVRRSDDEEWRSAETIVGLLHAARTHKGLDEYVIQDDEELIKAVVEDQKQLQLESTPAGETETIPEDRMRMLEDAINRLDDDMESEAEIDRRELPKAALIAGPAIAIMGTTAYAVWKSVTYDRYANKNFE